MAACVLPLAAGASMSTHNRTDVSGLPSHPRNPGAGRLQSWWTRCCRRTTSCAMRRLSPRRTFGGSKVRQLQRLVCTHNCS